MGRLNKRALIRQLRKDGVASRAGLARALGMSQPTAGKIADELLALGVLEEVEVEELATKTGETPRLGLPDGDDALDDLPAGARPHADGAGGRRRVDLGMATRTQGVGRHQGQ